MGDVGSGKTLVAFWAMLRAVECGHQAAMMAPTELLAEQHYRGFRAHVRTLGVRRALLTGKRDGCERAAGLCARSASGEIAVVFGTHALIQERVRMREPRARRDRRAASLRRFRSREAESAGAQGELLHDDGDADSAKPRDEPVRAISTCRFSTSCRRGARRSRPRFSPKTSSPQVRRDLRAEIDGGGRAYYVVPLIDGDEDDERKSVAATAARLDEGAARAARESARCTAG